MKKIIVSLLFVCITWATHAPAQEQQTFAKRAEREKHTYEELWQKRNDFFSRVEFDKACAQRPHDAVVIARELVLCLYAFSAYEGTPKAQAVVVDAVYAYRQYYT